MKVQRYALPLLAAALSLTASVPAARAQGLVPSQLVTGKLLTPQGTQTQAVGSFPANMVATPDGKYVLVSDMGFREYLTCLDAATGRLAQPITKPSPPPTKGKVPDPPVSLSLLSFGTPHGKPRVKTLGLYYGLAVRANGDGTYTAYASQGANGTIAVVKVGADGSLSQTGVIKMPAGDFPAGLSLDARGLLSVAVSENSIQPLLTPGSLVVYDTGRAVGPADTPIPAPEVARVFFNGAQDTFGAFRIAPGNPSLPFTPTNFPYAVYAAPQGGKVYVASERDGGVFAVSLVDPAAPTAPTTQAHPRAEHSDTTGYLYGFIPTGTQKGLTGGSHPVCLLGGGAGALYVANAADDSVSVLDTNTDAVTRTISLRPPGAARLPGATPTGLALSPDGATLYVTLADMNAVAVVGLASGAVQGYIPVGWYPTSVLASGGSLLVANAKGVATANPNPGHIKPTAAGRYENSYYDEQIIEGGVSQIPVPDAATLAQDTATVIGNNVASGGGTDTLARLGLGGSGRIKHVIYIVKENRTYDQVLGDVSTVNGKPVNGDASLTVFGESVTPNLHALAQRFLWLDNFYDCAEVSPDGWNWSTAAMAGAYTVKNVPYNYSGRGRSYDFEGQNNAYIVGGIPAKSPDGVPLSTLFPNGGSPIPDVATPPAGYLWDAVEKAGLSFRNYGFFTSGSEDTVTPDNYPTEPGLQPGGHYAGGPLDPQGNGRTDIDSREFDTNYADSDAPILGGEKTTYPLETYGKYDSKNRFQEWNREFQAMLAAAKADGNRYEKYVPSLLTVKFMSDHTAGYHKDEPTPAAHVADNDYAVAELVQTVSRSPLWASTAIFVIEDDAQDGPDHVDCHRSTCYVISPYLTPGTVDHAFHNTASVVKSIELLLGLPPLNQYDAYAPSFGPDFRLSPTLTPYDALPENDDIVHDVPTEAFLNAHPAYRQLVRLTDTMDFHKEDLAPPQLLNEVIWKSVKGMNARMPAPRHGVIPVRPASAAKKGKADKDGDGD